MTTAFEIQKLNFLLGLDEPGFLLQTLKSASLIKDACLNNKVCSQILALPGFNSQDYPFVVARNRNMFNLVNLKTGRSFALIKDLPSTAWYQLSMMVFP